MKIQTQKEPQISPSNSHFEKTVFFTLGTGMAFATSCYLIPSARKSIFEYAILHPAITHGSKVALEMFLQTSIFSWLWMQLNRETSLKETLKITLCLGPMLSAFIYKDYGNPVVDFLINYEPIFLSFLKTIFEITLSYSLQILIVIISIVMIIGFVIYNFIDLVLDTAVKNFLENNQIISEISLKSEDIILSEGGT